MTVKYLNRTIIIASAIVLLGAIYFFADARNSPLFPKCIFYSLTGLFCPGCGSQRAFSALLHGEIRQALNYNILFMAFLPLLLYSGLIALINVLANKNLQQPLFYSNYFVKIVLAVVLIFWIMRNLPFYPFSLLAPHLTK